MPVKKVVETTAIKPPINKFKTAPNKIDVCLPDKANIIAENLSDYTWLIYGERKIGKTKLFSEFKNPFFFMFDPLNKGLAIKQIHIPNWLFFRKAVDMLHKKIEGDPGYCDIVIIDTGFMCYERCYQYMMGKLGITDPQDKAWGSAWKEIGREFMEAHDKIFELDRGFGVTAHTAMVEVKRRDGSTYTKLTTQLGSQAFKFYNGLVDVIAYYQYNAENKRELSIQGDSLIEAGARIDEHFFYTNGNPIAHVPMGKNSKEAYKNLELAFNNKLIEPVKKEVKKLAKKIN